jgi:2-aminoadipate transaminase
MPAGARWTRPRGGFFTWVTFPDGVDAVDLARRAAEAGVAVVPGSPFFPDGRGGSSLRVCFSKVDDEAIDVGIERLAGLL